ASAVRDRHLQGLPHVQLLIDARGEDLDLVGQHEEAEHTDAETAVGPHAELRLLPPPLRLFPEELGRRDEPAPRSAEEVLQLERPHADAVVLALDEVATAF